VERGGLNGKALSTQKVENRVRRYTSCREYTKSLEKKEGRGVRKGGEVPQRERRISSKRGGRINNNEQTKKSGVKKKPRKRLSTLARGNGLEGWQEAH